MRSFESRNKRLEAVALSKTVEMLNMLSECQYMTVQLQAHRFIRSALASEGETDWR